MRTASGWRAVLIVIGLLALAQGLWVAYRTIPDVDRVHVLLWFVVGVAVHDGVVAPISVVLGRFGLARVAEPQRWMARALLAWTGSVLIIGLPLVRQDRHPANPTIEFGHPFVGVAVAVGLGVLVAATVQAALTLRRRAARPRPSRSHPR